MSCTYTLANTPVNCFLGALDHHGRTVMSCLSCPSIYHTPDIWSSINYISDGHRPSRPIRGATFYKYCGTRVTRGVPSVTNVLRRISCKSNQTIIGHGIRSITSQPESHAHGRLILQSNNHVSRTVTSEGCCIILSSMRRWPPGDPSHIFCKRYITEFLRRCPERCPENGNFVTG